MRFRIYRYDPESGAAPKIQEYDLDFFFAERHRTQSNFKITTNIVLENTVLPTVSNAYD